MKCPTCGAEQATEQGMRQHHTKVHDDPLPNRCCSGCDAAFYDPKARQEFCDDCDSNAGKHNGNWKGAMETSTCKICSESFKYYPSNKEGTYCQDCVDEAEGLLPENPQQKGPRKTIFCRSCGSELEARPSEVQNKTRGFFCGQECYGEWLSDNIVGPDHHQWEGGPIDYGQSWWSVRRAARERDDYKCQHCGRDKLELGRNPDVHHLTPVREFEQPENAHTLDNVITLCRSCHRRAEEGKIEITSQRKK